MEIKEIQDKIAKGEYRFSDHAVKRILQKHIDRFEVENAIAEGEIIEEYPDDKYSPSCLIYGKTRDERGLHIHISLPPVVVVITVYEPDAEEWIDCKIRR
ncbi:MAG: DUF4258 domain-containing protein [Deltaproteobacteria bacterium]|nr:DUF4258 domain-containing protein [Deltaproteobacteria bacterium]